MQITVKYFGQIAEITGKEKEIINFSGPLISDLLNNLYKTYDGLKNKDFQVAQDQELVSNETELNGTEIAILPPFAGG